MHEEPETDAELTPDDLQLADHLTSGRPVPRAGFRGALGRYLAARDPGYGPRPDRLRLIVVSYVGGGLVLAGFAALLAVGAL
jgi:hypothetical protein